MLRILFISLLTLLSAAPMNASARPPIEAYGALPSVRSMSISPSGNRVVYFRRETNAEYAMVYSFSEDRVIAAVEISDIKARSARFVDEDYVILSVSDTIRAFRIGDKFEYSAAFSWNLDTNYIRRMLQNEREMYSYQGGLGRIVGKPNGSNHVFMPAYMVSITNTPSFDLLKVDLDSGRGSIHARGGKETKDWLVRDDGEILAREEYDGDTDKYSIWLYENGKSRKIFEEKIAIPRLSVIGVTPDGVALVLSAHSGDSERNAILTMSFDGLLSKPLFSRTDADVESVISDVNRVVYGVQYSGLTPSYEFFDNDLQDLLPLVETLFPNAAVTHSGWTPDFDTLIVHVAGGSGGPAYYFFKPRERTLMRVAQVYEDIPDDHVGAVIPIDYRTRDGQQLTAILTLPPGAEMNGRHPTIIMPHGGPASYDAVGFDWMAQFFANRGYAVVQPNFRGSTGFGKSFEESGYGEWGRGVMQHDVTDALKAVVNSGISDPDRVCIIGASYGGYAALAGGAFTPELYKCVAGIAPVADLPQMIFDERRESGRNSWVVAYWTKLIGDVRTERDKLNEISPAKHADAFQAPVLLIHGNDDIVVPYEQSEIMSRALKRAGKDVELVKVKGGDHWLSTSETRLETLRALDVFVAEHLQPLAGTSPALRSP